MARSSTDRFPGPQRQLLAGALISVVLHAAVVQWLWPEAAPARLATPGGRSLVLTWVHPDAPVVPLVRRTAAPHAAPDALPKAPVAPSASVPTPEAVATALSPQTAALPLAAASAPAVPEAASAPVAGVAWAPPRWNGFSAGWGRTRAVAAVSALDPPDASTLSARVAQQQSSRLTAQQQQALVEMAWRSQADEAQQAAGW